MGTRSLTVVVLGGKNVVAQYCQWDGYPAGQGANILQFLNKGFNRDKFIERVKFTRFIDDEETDSLYQQVLNVVPGQFLTIEDAAKFATVYPTLDRELGGRVIEFIQEGKFIRTKNIYKDSKILLEAREIIATQSIPLHDNSLFAKHGSCEWIWTVNLDDNTFTGLWNFSNFSVSWPLSALPNCATLEAAFDRGGF